MDPLTVLQCRIEQLEARLGLATCDGEEGGHEASGAKGESATESLLAAAQCIDTAVAGQDKLAAAAARATELNNYTDPNYLQNVQQSEMQMQEIIASEPAIRHHCRCMQRCQKAAPALESEAVQQVPQLQQELTQLQANAAELRAEADTVAHGVQQVAETCGSAAGNASEALMNVAKEVENAESKMFPKRRNGLD